MSTPEPPNQTSSEWAPPSTELPPPPPPPPAWSTGAAPPGFESYGTHGVIRPSGGLAKAALALYWCRTAVTGLSALAFWNRLSVITTAMDHAAIGSVTAADVDADDRAVALVGLVGLLGVALNLAAAIVTSLWARRVTENARARGDRQVRPGLATGGWYIPIGWYWVGFNQVKEAVRRAGHDPKTISRWQTSFVLATLIGSLTIRLGENGNTLDGLKTAAGTGIAASLIGMALLVWCTRAATKAMRATADALG